MLLTVLERDLRENIEDRSKYQENKKRMAVVHAKKKGRGFKRGTERAKSLWYSGVVFKYILSRSMIFDF